MKSKPKTVLVLAKNKKLPKVTVWLNGSKKTMPKTVLAVAKNIKIAQRTVWLNGSEKRKPKTELVAKNIKIAQSDLRSQAATFLYSFCCL